MENFTFSRVERRGHTLIVTIDRPQVLNALHPPAHAELERIFDIYETDPELRVAILTASGERAFCVGSDLKVRSQTGRDELPRTGFGGITKRTAMLKPVIAAVNGLCLGGGTEIVAACDLAIAASHAEFALPEPRVGLAALGGGALQRLARQLPLKEANWLTLTARRMPAEHARRIGLINEVVPADRLMIETLALADDILACAPLSIQATKQVMLGSLNHASLDDALNDTYPAAERMLASEDAVEGQRAFVEKRKPHWRGR